MSVGEVPVPWLRQAFGHSLVWLVMHAGILKELLLPCSVPPEPSQAPRSCRMGSGGVARPP